MNNTRLDLDIIDDEIPSSQQSPPMHRIIPISCDIESLDEVFDEEGINIITETREKIEAKLKRRHHAATLTRDLRRFSLDELPSYARIARATFVPFIGDPVTEKYFDNKVSEFNRKICREFREYMLNGAKEVVNTVAKEIETIWRDAYNELSNGHKESGKNICKLNDRVMELKTKWAAENQKAAGIHEKQARRAEPKTGIKDKSEIYELERELDDLKKELDRNRDSRYYREGNRGRRFKNQYRRQSYQRQTEF